MGDAGVIADVEAGARQAAGQIIKIVDVDRTFERRIFRACTPEHRYRALQLRGEPLEIFEPPILLHTAGEWLDDREVFPRHIAMDSRNAVAFASYDFANLIEIELACGHVERERWKESNR